MLTTAQVFELALETAQKSIAKKRKVGAVIATPAGAKWQVYATGFNHKFGAECEDEAGSSLPDVVHAEEAALNSVNNSIPHDSCLFVTHEPCPNCVAAFSKCLPEVRDIKSRIHVVSSGMKLDDGKLRYDLIPHIVTESLAAVLTYGAKKYKPENWRSVDPQRYVAAVERHWHAYLAGELIDKESGLPHLAMAMTNLGFLLELQHKPKQQQTLADYCKNL